MKQNQMATSRAVKAAHSFLAVCNWRKFGVVLAVILSSAGAKAANTADNYTGSGTGSLLTTGNWSLSAAPTVANDAVFTGTSGIRTLNTANLTVGSFNVTASSGTFSIRTEANNTTDRNLILGGPGDLGNSVSGTVAGDLLYVANGAIFVLRGDNPNNTGVLKVQLGQSGNFNVVGTLTIGAAISGSSFGFTKSGGGTLSLTNVNTYSGNTVISVGTLTLSGSGSIANSPTIEIAGGATFDVSGLTTALTLASGQVIKASGTATTGTIATTTGKGLTTASDSPLQFTAFNGSVAPLTLSGAGTLTLASGNPVTVTVANGGTPLGLGDYKLIAKGATGTVSGTPSSVTVNGDGVITGASKSLVNNGSELYLRVSCTAPTTGTPTAAPSSTVCAGTQFILTESASGGASPFTYQWYKGATAILNATNTTYTNASPVAGDSANYSCVVTSACGSASTSAVVAVTVNANVTPAVSVSANPGFTTCSANQIVFTATPVNGGTPTYQWYLNNNPVGFNSVNYTNGSGGLANSDQIYVKMTSSLACVTASIAYSPTNTMTISGSTTPTVGISLNTGTPTNCPGSQIIFTASPTNGGGSPTYIWKTNSVVDPSSTSATYTNSSFVNGDTVDCQLTSSDACASPTTANAPQVTLTVKPNLTPTVSIAASPGPTNCPGTQIIFTATPVNGGVSPSYQWKTNGFNSGGNSATYTNSSLANGDVIACVLTPSAEVCASPANATSSSLTNYLNPTVTPAVSIAASPGTTNAAGATVTFTATPVNGGVSPGYQWKTNTGSVPGATSSSFATTTLSNNDVVTCVLTPSAEICASPATATSAGITNVIISLPTITTQPQSRTNSVGDNAAFSVSSTGSFRSFQWYFNNAAISGATNSSYTRSSVGAADAGNFTVIITNIAGAVTSTPAVLTLIGTNSIKLAQWDFNSITPDATTSTGSSTPSTGSGTATTLNGVTAAFASGTGSSDPAASDNTRWTTTSYPATSVSNKTAGVQFAVSTVGYTNVVLSWEQQASGTASRYTRLQYSVNGTDFIDTSTVIAISTATTFFYQTADLSALPGVANNANFKFRVVSEFQSTATGSGPDSYLGVSGTYNNGGAGSVGFDLVTLFAQPLPPAITTQPSSLTNCSGNLASFTAAATGVVTPYPQWQLSTDTGGTWNNIGGATADTYSFTPSHTDNGSEFRVIYTNAWFASTSTVATLTIRPVPVANNVTYSFNQGSALKLLVASLLTNASDSAAGTISLVSVGNSANGVAVSTDATRVSYSGLLTNNDSFTYTVSSSTCGETATGTVFLTALGNLTGQYSTNIVTVAGTNLTVTFFGISNYTYQVQRSTNLISWVTLLTTNPVASGPFKIQDTIGVAPSSAFYRLLIP